MIVSHGVRSRCGTFALGVVVFFLLLHPLRHKYRREPETGQSFSHDTEAAIDEQQKSSPREDFPKKI